MFSRLGIAQRVYGSFGLLPLRLAAATFLHGGNTAVDEDWSEF